MTGCERILSALRGDWPDRVPVMMHNFMHAAREAGVSMGRYRGDPTVIADVLWRSAETYGLDGLLVDIDTATLADAVGVPVELPDDEPARAVGGCLSTLEQVDDLRPVDISQHPRIEAWLRAVELLVKRSNNEVAIRGNCDQCPFSLASMMRSPELWLMDLTDEQQYERIDHLLAYCTDITMQFVRLMVQTGCHVVSNGDSPAGPDMISPAMYARFALPWQRQVVQQAHALGLPYVLHICGNTSVILDLMLQSGADGLELDYKTDPVIAHQVMAEQTTFIGNLDPTNILARASVNQVKAAAHDLMKLFVDTPRFVLNSGCAIPADAPAENIHAAIEAAREFRPSTVS